MRCNEIAAAIHKDMVLDDSNGYSWEPRHGEDGKPVKTITIDGKKYSYDRGSWDCSSSVIKAWQLAIQYTPYKGKLDAAGYTGNMRSVFTKSGLFVWKPMSFIAARGDLYLNEANHVAMCQSQDPDVMSEFCINEKGEVYGGLPGDQTGGEAAINPFRDEFDGILHYNGKADTSTSAPATKWTDGTYATLGTMRVWSDRRNSSTVVCVLAKGTRLKLREFKKNGAGNIWAKIASGDHAGRFVCAQIKTKEYLKRV